MELNSIWSWSGEPMKWTPLTPAAYINSLKVRMATDAECVRQYGISLQEWLKRWATEKPERRKSKD